MINKNYIAVYDYETGGSNPEECEPIQVASVILDPRTFKIVDTFESMIRALEPDKLEAGALKVNKKTVEQIMAARHPEEVFGDFFTFLKKYKTEKSKWGNPIPCGHNIVNFDEVITNRYCKKYKLDYPFHMNQKMDTLHLHLWWFENAREPQKYNMDELRGFYGIKSENAHDALQDCKDVATIVSRFLTMHRSLVPKIKFKTKYENREEEKTC